MCACVCIGGKGLNNDTKENTFGLLLNILLSLSPIITYDAVK